MKKRWRNKNLDVDVHFFHLTPGCHLCFRASELYHGSILPTFSEENETKEADISRALLILHAYYPVK